MSDQQVGKAVEEGHRVEITFNGDEGMPPMLRLLHPAEGCDPGEDGAPGTCWLADWLENADEPERMLRGTVAVPVTYELDGDQPLFHLAAIQPLLVQSEPRISDEVRAVAEEWARAQRSVEENRREPLKDWRRRVDETEVEIAKALQRILDWPHETPPGRCVHWPKTCADVQAASPTFFKPCAHCCPEAWNTAASPQAEDRDGVEEECDGSGLITVQGEAAVGQASAVGVPESRPCPGCERCAPQPQLSDEDREQLERIARQIEEGSVWVGLTDDQAQAVRVDVALLRKLADPDPNFGKPTGTRCEACDKEEHVGDEGWESGEGLSWCPDCFEEEDCDDLCTCNHARFHHDDGREMGVYTNCKAGGCACQKFVHHVPTKGEEGR